MIDTRKMAIDKFARDISCLNPVYKELSKINFFEVLKIDKVEIRHSNMLAWLLDPSKPSGLGDKLLKQLLFKCAEGSESILATDIELMDLDDVSVQREVPLGKRRSKDKGRIDLLISSASSGFVICIENKIGSTEIKGNDDVDGQLRRYYNYVEKNYQWSDRFYILLSPNGVMAEDELDRDIWTTLDYDEICQWICSISNIYASSIPNNAKILIEQYVDSLRRNVIFGEFNNICDKIYRKHLSAFEIFEEYKSNKKSKKNKDDRAYLLYLKHQDAIDCVLENRVSINDKIKENIALALTSYGYIVEYNPKKAALLVKVPKESILSDRIVANEPSVDNDYLHFRIYVAPGNTGIWFNLHTNPKNKPDNLDVLGELSKLLNKKVTDTTMLKSLTIASGADVERYKNDIGQNEPDIEDDFYKAICGKVEEFFARKSDNGFAAICDCLNMIFGDC